MSILTNKTYPIYGYDKYPNIFYITGWKVEMAGEKKREDGKYISLWSSNYQITQLKLGFSYLKTRLSRVSSIWNVI